MAGQHVVLTCPSKQSAGEHAQKEQKCQIAGDNEELRHASTPSSAGNSSETKGHAYFVARNHIMPAPSEMPA